MTQAHNPLHSEAASLNRDEPPPEHCRPPAVANGHQVGGDHYQRGGEQHWDFVERNGIGYLEAAVSKYLVRHPFKGSQALDLQKAEHYAQKLLELNLNGQREQRGVATFQESLAWAQEQAGLDEVTRTAIAHVLSWQTPGELEACLVLIGKLRDTAR